jgi:hypothetical protein
MPFADQPKRWPRQRGIPDGTWRKAKAAAALTDLPMDSWVTQAIELAVEMQTQQQWEPIQLLSVE